MIEQTHRRIAQMEIALATLRADYFLNPLEALTAEERAILRP